MLKLKKSEKRLRKRAEEALAELQGMRRNKTEDIFAKRYLIGPEELLIENYPRKRPLAAFNPGAVLLGDTVLIFPRLIFDYYSYSSSIGAFSLPVEGLLSGEFERPIRTRIVLWPQYGWEAVKGCEDPRVLAADGRFWVLYTAVGKIVVDGSEQHKPVLAFAELDGELQVKRKGFFSIEGPDGALIPGNKDSTFLAVKGKRARVLTRPSFSWDSPLWLESVLPTLGRRAEARLPDMCWRAEADLDRLVLLEDSLWPVLVPEPWEQKVGWSTNAVEVSAGRFLVGWHGVLRDDLSYRNGLALVNEEGEVLAVSDYLLAPRGLQEQYGDRCLTIFGNGLILYEGRVIWIGGVSDYAIGVFVADLDDVRARLRRL